MRHVSAVVTAGDRVVGGVGPFAVDVPWWAEVEPVVAHLRTVLGVPAYVLRLLTVEGGDGARDGHVTYHVEAPGTTASLPAAPLPGDDDPLRAYWATAAGLAELFDWARDALGVPLTGPIEQRKTWNLAGLFRLPTASGPVWLKALPPFAADEAQAMALVATVDPTLVPQVLAAAPGRLLLSDVPGKDCWQAPPAVLANGIARFVHAQSTLETAPPWLAPGDDPTPVPTMPPRDAQALPPRADPTSAVEALLSRDLGLTPAEVAATRALLPRWSTLAECGLPNTLVHGDFHPGNWRSASNGPPTILDFADAHYGHPVLDGLRVLDFLSPDRRPAARTAWIAAWRAARPNSDPARALTIAEPLAHLYYAIRYQEFLDGIEHSERIYHQDDPASSIRAALACASPAFKHSESRVQTP